MKKELKIIRSKLTCGITQNKRFYILIPFLEMSKKNIYIHINVLQLKYITYLCAIYSSRDRSVHMQTCWKHVHGVIIITPAWSGQKEFLFQHSSFNSWKLNRLLNSILVKCVNYFLSAVNTWLHICIYSLIQTRSLAKYVFRFHLLRIRFFNFCQR